MSKTVKQTATLDPEVRAWMKGLGYVHEQDLAAATSTLPTTRARWGGLRGVLFGNEKYYRLTDIKRFMDSKADSIYNENDDLEIL